jgi:hypothetical protein
VGAMRGVTGTFTIFTVIFSQCIPVSQLTGLCSLLNVMYTLIKLFLNFSSNTLVITTVTYSLFWSAHN